MPRFWISLVLLVEVLLSARPTCALSLSDLRIEDQLAKPGVALLVLYFHSSTCAACRRLAPNFGEVRTEFPPESGVRFVAISTDESSVDACVSPGFSVEQDECDPAGTVRQALFARGIRTEGLPAFVALSWRQQSMFVISASNSPVRDLRDGLKRFQAENPVLELSASDEAGLADPDLEREVRSALVARGKMAVAAAARNRARLPGIRKRASEPENREAPWCLGSQLPTSSMLVVDRLGPGRHYVEAITVGTGATWYAATTGGGVDAAMQAFHTFARGESMWGVTSGVKPSPALAVFRSDPPGAAVLVDDVEVCAAGQESCRASVRAGEHRVEMRADGYVEKAASLRFECGMAPVAMALEPETKDHLRIQPAAFQMGSPKDEPGRHSDEAQRRIRITQPSLVDPSGTGRHDRTQNDDGTFTIKLDEPDDGPFARNGSTPAEPPLVPAEYLRLMHQAAAHYNIPESLIKAVAAVESERRFDPKQVTKSACGRRLGLMGLDRRDLAVQGVEDFRDPAQNIFGGTRKLRLSANDFGGDLVLTLSAYCRGNFSVDSVGGIPDGEAAEYVRRVLNLYYRYQR